MKHVNFLKKALTDYRVGAITISSRFVVSGVLKNIKPDSKYIVEYGPGNGVITSELLKILPPGGKLVAIERNKEFCEELKKIEDPRLTVINGSIIELSKDLEKNTGLPKIDAVISSVPFTYFKPKDREDVIENIHRELSDGGVFIVFQYSLLISKLLKKYFRNFSFRLEPRNLPPYFIMRAEK